MTQEDKTQIFKNIAVWLLAGIQPQAIAQMLECTLEQLTQLRELESYKAVELQVTVEKQMRGELRDESWDDIEDKAKKVVNEALKGSRDGDFALRVAMVANKARRRGAVAGENTLQAQQGMRTTIQLPAGYVAQLKQDGNKTEISVKPQQHYDMLKPDRVEKLFNVGQDKPKEINPFDDIQIIG